MKIILTFLFCIQSVYAFDTDSVLHPVAHGAGSYALTHAGTVACKKLTSLNQTACSLISGAVTMGVGIAIEATQEQAEGQWKHGIAYDLAGIGIAIGIINLDF